MCRLPALPLLAVLLVSVAVCQAHGQRVRRRVVFSPEKGVGYWVAPATGISNPTRNRWSPDAGGGWFTPAVGTGLWHSGLPGVRAPGMDRWARTTEWRSGRRGVWFTPYPGQQPRQPRKAQWQRWTAGSSLYWPRAATVLSEVGWVQPPGLPPVLWTDTSWGFGVWATPGNGPRPQNDPRWRRVSGPAR